MTTYPESSGPVISRWSIPVAGLFLTLIGGIAYAWGVFVVPLQTAFGWSRADAVLPVSVFLVMYVAGMLLGGYLQDRFGPRRIIILGGVLFFIGYALAAQVHHFPYVWWLVLTYGIVAGTASGVVYSVVVPTCRKWFPDRTAVAVAIGVTGFGLAAVLFAPWLSHLLGTIGIGSTFFLLAFITLAVSLVGAWIYRLPPADWTPPQGKGGQPAGSTVMLAPRAEMTVGEVMRTPLFYLLWLGFFSVIFGGLMAMAHLVPFGRTILGLEAPVAALAMVFFGLTNGLGRIAAGLLAEKFGPTNVMLGTYLFVGLGFLLFNTLATTAGTLYLFAFLFGWGFAVTLGLFPTLTTVSFGVKNLGAVYGAVITAFAAGAFFGPMVGGWAYDATGSYVLPFAMAGAFAMFGWTLVLLAYKLKYKLP